MRFGGHETFHIREGWLHKGLRLLVNEPTKLSDEYSADWLGVGRNMAKSIRYWLQATNLAEVDKVGKNAPLRVSNFGNLIYKSDPYFLDVGTWWLLHINMLNNQAHALTWTWFFNNFNFPRFDRAMCIDALIRYLEQSSRKRPEVKTLQRDVACLLNSYAIVFPRDYGDPEEATECPLIELDLLHYFKASGQYQLNVGIKHIPPEIFGYCVALAFPFEIAGNGHAEIPFREISSALNGPGRCFALTAETLFDVISTYEINNADGSFEITSLAGERVLSIPRLSASAWLKKYYGKSTQLKSYAA